MKNQKSKNSKTSKQKKVLAASVTLAVVIVAGSTFAWFTSQDTVTNQLTASNNYGVSITETFTSTDSWAPGQEVNKDVSAINTGNIDAFVKLSLSSTLSLKNYTVPGDTSFTDGNKESYVKPSNAEVTALQAGGYLFYTDAANVTYPNLEAGTDFEPTAAGYYVFLRETNTTADGTTYEYTGYYFDGTDFYEISIDKATSGTGSFTGKDGNTKYDLSVKKTATSNAFAGDWTYTTTDIATDNKIIAKYDPDDTVTGDEIIINILLANGWGDNWTFDESNMTFYYNYVLEAGKESQQLIDALVLDSSVENDAYQEFVYNLNVTADSIQTVGEYDADDTTSIAQAVNADSTWKNVDSITKQEATSAYLVAWKSE